MGWIERTHLGRRILVAVFGIPLIFGAAILGGWYFFVLIGLLIVFALAEFYMLAEKLDYSPSRWTGIPAVLVLHLFLFLNYRINLGITVAAFLMVIVLSELFRNKPHPVANIAVTFYGTFYIFLLSFFVLLREVPRTSRLAYGDGAWLIILIFSAIWLCDSTAYIAGSCIGKHALFPRVSPKKTWEGAVSGFLMAVVSAVITGSFIHSFLPFHDALILGVLIGVFAQLSDLVESLFKRDAGIKDTSHMLPGHGGFFDRFDSFILVGPVVYIYLHIRGYF